MAWIAREHAPRLSFLESRWSVLDEWKTAARHVLRQRLSYNPTPVPLAAELVSREERDGFTLGDHRDGCDLAGPQSLG
jgi:hypothetical protein